MRRRETLTLVLVWTCGCGDPEPVGGEGGSAGEDAAATATEEGDAAATGGDAASSTAGDPSGTPDDGDADGTADGSGTGGGGGGLPRPDCRTYATEYHFDASTGVHDEYSCTHAETADGFDRICTVSGAIDTEHWASVADFVDEAGAVGLRRLQSWSRDLGGGAPYVTLYEYDDAGRLERITLSNDAAYVYDEWDEYGRPTHGSLLGDCPGYEVTHEYDDEARTFTETWSGTGGSQGCNHTIRQSFDEEMIRVGVVYEYNGATATYTTLATATVCK